MEIGPIEYALYVIFSVLIVEQVYRKINYWKKQLYPYNFDWSVGI